MCGHQLIGGADVLRPWRVGSRRIGTVGRSGAATCTPSSSSNAHTKFDVRSFTRSWDNRGTQTIWAVPGYTHAPFLQTFEWAIVQMDLVNIPAKFEARTFTHSWDNSDWSFGDCEPQYWGRGGRRGSALVPFERVLVSSYRLSIVTFLLSVRLSEILLLLCFPDLTSSLPQIFPCFPGSRWMAFGLRRPKVLG